MTLPIKTVTSVLKVSTKIIISITSRPIRLTAIVIMFVSNYKTAVVLYFSLLSAFFFYIMTARLDGEGNLRYLPWTEHWNHRPLGDVWKPKHLSYSVTKIYIYPSGQKIGYTYICKILDLIFYFALRYFKHTPNLVMRDIGLDHEKSKAFDKILRSLKFTDSNILNFRY